MRILPLEKYGVKLLSIGFVVDKEKAVLWRGAMASNALKQLIMDAAWGDLDYFVIDMPPGTSDIHLTLVQTLGITGAIVVTTPQEVVGRTGECAGAWHRGKYVVVHPRCTPRRKILYLWKRRRQTFGGKTPSAAPRSGAFSGKHLPQWRRRNAGHAPKQCIGTRIHRIGANRGESGRHPKCLQACH